MITALLYLLFALITLAVLLFGLYVAVVCWCVGASIWEMRRTDNKTRRGM